MGKQFFYIYKIKGAPKKITRGFPRYNCVYVTYVHLFTLWYVRVCMCVCIPIISDHKSEKIKK